ncbi:MAG TPA: hypothetical protein VE974_23800 [Thermoanaerobaculia bacterium]|nr:hypothetical protein [Thermoanaerobaculia bacterium]
MKARLVVLCPLLVYAFAGRAQEVVSAIPKEVVRGTTLELKIAKLPSTTTAVTARLERLDPETTQPEKQTPLKLRAASAEPPPAPALYKIDIPTYYPLGVYHVTDLKAGETTIASEPLVTKLILASDPKITSAYPVPAAYPTVPTGKQEEFFTIDVVGEGFSHLAADQHLLLDGEEIPNVTNTPTADGRKITFSDIPLRYHGRRKVGVRVGDKISTTQADVVLSWVVKTRPREIAMLVTFILLAVILVLAWRGRKGIARANRPNILASFFYDEQTRSYSVSKAQFYMWTFAAIFGWVYLTASRSLVQGFFEFAQVPEHLPGILLISAGTAVIATGIGSDKTKGAGAPSERISDFITTGGMVVPERVQFVVWTILGVGAFLALVGSSDPGAIEDLPKIPEGFLYLMGISSAGYLGGKMVRQPGPIIDSVVATLNTPLTIVVTGRNLSIDARLVLDAIEVEAAWLEPVNGKHSPEVIAKEEENPQYAKELKFKLANVTEKESKLIDLAPGKTISAQFVLGVINRDGQRAEKNVTLTSAAPVTTP